MERHTAPDRTRWLRRPAWPLSLLMLLALAAGCTSFTDLEDFEIVPWDQTQFAGEILEGPEVIAEGGSREIDISGRIRVGGCSHFHARLKREGRTLTLRVVSRPAGACPAIPVTYPYTARIEGLSPGEHRLIVVYGHSPRYHVAFDDVLTVAP